MKDCSFHLNEGLKVANMLGDVIKIILIIIFTIIFIWSIRFIFNYWQEIVKRNQDEKDD